MEKGSEEEEKFFVSAFPMISALVVSDRFLSLHLSFPLVHPHRQRRFVLHVRRTRASGGIGAFTKS